MSRDGYAERDEADRQGREAYNAYRKAEYDRELRFKEEIEYPLRRLYDDAKAKGHFGEFGWEFDAQTLDRIRQRSHITFALNDATYFGFKFRVIPVREVRILTLKCIDRRTGRTVYLNHPDNPDPWK